jgi:hypothetical protein
MLRKGNPSKTFMQSPGAITTHTLHASHLFDVSYNLILAHSVKWSQEPVLSVRARFISIGLYNLQWQSLSSDTKASVITTRYEPESIIVSIIHLKARGDCASDACSPMQVF